MFSGTFRPRRTRRIDPRQGELSLNLGLQPHTWPSNRARLVVVNKDNPSPLKGANHRE